jgi:trehalose 6-phosphate synthase/phosphatase
LQGFLLELGRGFCFEGRQRRITFDNTHYRIDLVFYHRILKCHVLLELKMMEFTHADAGQMNGYLNMTLEKWFDHLPIGLIAEHGARIRHPKGEWKTEVSSNQPDWMPKIEKIMQAYLTRCPHSFIEKKEFSLAWHYRNADLVQGNIRAKELYEDLLLITEKLNLSILFGNKVVEVRVLGINKGEAVKKILHTGSFDFILSI